MTRLNFIVEGKTELRFVENILRPRLGSLAISVHPQIVLFGKHGDEIYRGGIKTYTKPRKHIQDWLKQDLNQDVYFTTMFDFYRLPTDFPSYDQIKSISDPYRKIQILENAFAADIQDSRFIPYIQLHEFETLLFADVQQFDWVFLEHDTEIHKLQNIAEQFANIELINDSPDTAPSKRIIKLIPEYESGKASNGPLIAEKIGLEKLRAKCQHFHHWLTQLEQLK